MWGPSIRWRPAKDEPLSGLTFRRLYLFNLPIYIVGMIVAVFLFSAMTGEDSPVTGSVPIWIAGAAITGALLDLIACLLLRRFWNRRARELGA